VIGRAPKAVGENHVDSRKAEEARFLLLGGQASPETPRWEVGMEVSAVLQPAAGLETAGERSVLRGGWDATLLRRSADRSLEIFLDAEASFYDWSASAPLAGAPTDSFNDLYVTRIGTLLQFDQDEQLSWFTGLEVTVSGEDSASIGEAVSVGAVTGVDVVANDQLTLSVGLAALTRLEDSAWVLPYFGFDWQLTERTRFGTDGAGLLLESRLDDAWTARAATRYELRQFRLNPDNAIPRGVYQDDQITLTGTIERRLGASATLSLSAGAVLWQESRYLDGAGTKLGEVETEPGLYGAISLRFGS
jgi:hypothetical protein